MNEREENRGEQNERGDEIKDFGGVTVENRGANIHC